MKKLLVLVAAIGCLVLAGCTTNPLNGARISNGQVTVTIGTTNGVPIITSIDGLPGVDVGGWTVTPVME